MTLNCPNCGTGLRLTLSEVPLEAPSAPLPLDEPPHPAATQTPIQPRRAAEWVCPVHGTSKTVPAGVSKKTGRPYAEFVACPEYGCQERPG